MMAALTTRSPPGPLDSTTDLSSERGSLSSSAVVASTQDDQSYGRVLASSRTPFPQSFFEQLGLPSISVVWGTSSALDGSSIIRNLPLSR